MTTAVLREIAEKILVKALLMIAIALVKLFNELDDSGPDYQVVQIENSREGFEQDELPF